MCDLALCALHVCVQSCIFGKCKRSGLECRAVLEGSKVSSAYVNAVETAKERQVLQLIIEQLRVCPAYCE